MMFAAYVLACLCADSRIFRGSDAAKLLEYSLSRELPNGQLYQRDLDIRQSKTNIIDQEILNMNPKGAYFASVRVGSPPQDVSLMLGTTAQVSLLMDKAGSCSISRFNCVTPCTYTLRSVFD